MTTASTGSAQALTARTTLSRSSTCATLSWASADTSGCARSASRACSLASQCQEACAAANTPATAPRTTLSQCVTGLSSALLSSALSGRDHNRTQNARNRRFPSNGIRRRMRGLNACLRFCRRRDRLDGALSRLQARLPSEQQRRAARKPVQRPTRPSERTERAPQPRSCCSARSGEQPRTARESSSSSEVPRSSPSTATSAAELPVHIVPVSIRAARWRRTAAALNR